MHDEAARAHVHVTGRVQGVWFRRSTAEEARSLRLAGWVRNVGDDVEAVFEGPRPAVERAVLWCQSGPPNAHVELVDVSWEEPEGLSGFSVRY